MTQYGEPWRWDVDANHKETLAYLMSSSECVLSTAQDYEWCPSKEDAERIVACVNACAGITSSVLNDPHQCLMSLPDHAVAHLQLDADRKSTDENHNRIVNILQGWIQHIATKTEPPRILCDKCATDLREADAKRWEEWKAAHPTDGMLTEAELNRCMAVAKAEYKDFHAKVAEWEYQDFIVPLKSSDSFTLKEVKSP